MPLRSLSGPEPTGRGVDYEDDRDDGEEDAVDVDVERRRRSLVSRRALSFPTP